MMLLVRFLLRSLIVLILLTNAVGKLLDNRGFAEVLGTYGIFPVQMLLPVALSISLFELFLALWIMSAHRGRLASFIVFALHGFYGLASYWAVYHQMNVSNWGTFGVYLPMPLSMSTVYEETGIALLCFLLFKLSPRG